MSKSSNWDDLRSRLISGFFLLFVSAICIYLGGYFLTLFVILLVGVMHWELGKMLSLCQHKQCGLVLFFQ